eukprot:154206-Rhodomonas_salina.1
MSRLKKWGLSHPVQGRMSMCEHGGNPLLVLPLKWLLGVTPPSAPGPFLRKPKPASQKAELRKPKPASGEAEL